MWYLCTEMSEEDYSLILSTIRRTKEQAAQSGLFFCILFYKHSKK